VLTFGSVFSGVGLLDYGLHLAGIDHAWFCEWDEWRRGILGKRWPGVPVYDDIRAVGAQCPGVHGIAGGFPCKGASTVGKREGFGHPETVLWFEMARAIGELRPRYVLVENVANILGLHDGEVWGTVLGDLVALGYDIVWDCLPAAAVGAPHLRDRVFAVATHAEDFGHERSRRPRDGRAGLADGGQPVADAPRDAEGGTGPEAGTDRERAWTGADAPADATSEDGQGTRPEREALGRAAASRGEAAPDSAIPGREARLSDSVGVGGGPDAGLLGPSYSSVDWGQYRGAIDRWEEVVGSAPEPLVRGMDARGAARVVRSRLSALGDGVQVQVGYIAGRYILELEEGRLVA
jgi:DNA (cytosine-5)-methyltransferase 1